MKQPPIGGERTRYDLQKIQDLTAEEKLSDLVKFLESVGPDARLRAKEENGIRFLHTRTGTPLGKFWKWLTVGWPNAVEQRKLFKSSVEEILNDIKVNKSEDIQSLKEKILNQTLAVQPLKEFNLQELKNSLKILRAVVSAERDGSSNSPSDLKSVPKNQAPKDKPTVLFTMPKQGCDDEESESSFSDSPIFVQTTELTGKSGVNATEIDSTALPYPVEQASIEVAVVHEYSAKADDKLSDTPPEMPPETAQAKGNPLKITPQPPPQRLKPQSPKAQDSFIAAEKMAVAADAGMIESTWPAALELRNTFGCKPIDGLLSASVGTVGDYFADCYIFPTDSLADLKFKLGTWKFSAAQEKQPGVSLSSGEHIFHDERRSVTKLRLEKVHDQDAGLVKTLDPTAHENYIAQIRQRYETALEAAFQGGAKTFVIQPLGSTLLTEAEIKILHDSIAAFQRQHAGTKIQVVFSGGPLVQKFKALLTTA